MAACLTFFLPQRRSLIKPSPFQSDLHPVSLACVVVSLSCHPAPTLISFSSICLAYTLTHTLIAYPLHFNWHGFHASFEPLPSPSSLTHQVLTLSLPSVQVACVVIRLSCLSFLLSSPHSPLSSISETACVIVSLSCHPVPTLLSLIALPLQFNWHARYRGRVLPCLTYTRTLTPIAHPLQFNWHACSEL